MTARAAYKAKVYAYAATDSDAAPAAVATYTEITSIDSVDFNESRLNLEKTRLGDPDGVRRYFLGLKEGTVSFSGFYDPADTGMDEVRTAFDGDVDAVVWIMIAWTGDPADGTTHVKCVPGSYNRQGAVAERVNLSVDLNFNGAPVAGPTA